MRRPKLKMGRWRAKSLLTPPRGDFRRAKISITEKEGVSIVYEPRLRSRLFITESSPELVRAVLLSEWKNQTDEEIIEALKEKHPKEEIESLLKRIHAAEEEGFFAADDGALNLFEKLSRIGSIGLSPLANTDNPDEPEIDLFLERWCIPLFGAILWNLFDKKSLIYICQADGLQPQPGHPFRQLKKPDLIYVMAAFLCLGGNMLPALQDQLNHACRDEIAHIQQLGLPEIEALCKAWRTLCEEGVFGKFLWALLVDEREGIEQTYEPALEEIVQPYHETKSPIPMELFSMPYNPPKVKPPEPTPPRSESQPSSPEVASLLKQMDGLKKRAQKAQKRIQELQLKNAELKRQVSRLNAIKGQLTKENRALSRQVQLKQAQRDEVQSSEVADAQLRQTVKTLRGELHEAQGKIQRLEAQLLEKEAEISRLRAERYRIKSAYHVAPPEAFVEDAPRTTTNEGVTSKPLAGKVIAIIGGRDNLGTRYTQMVEELGGVLKWHCGVEGLGHDRIEDALTDSHGCLIITGAVKHAARDSAIKIAQNLKIPYWFHASAGISSIRRFLIAHAHELAEGRSE